MFRKSSCYRVRALVVRISLLQFGPNVIEPNKPAITGWPFESKIKNKPLPDSPYPDACDL